MPFLWVDQSNVAGQDLMSSLTPLAPGNDSHQKIDKHLDSP